MAKLDGINVDIYTCDWVRDVTFILAFSNSVFNPILNSLFLFNFAVGVCGFDARNVNVE